METLVQRKMHMALSVQDEYDVPGEREDEGESGPSTSALVSSWADLENHFNAEAARCDGYEGARPSQKTWTQLMHRMDGSGPPIKRTVQRSSHHKGPLQAPASARTDDDAWTSAYFEPRKHGYFRVRGELVYRTPDGRQVPATGVDAFGPFVDAPQEVWNEQFYWSGPPPASKKGRGK